MNLIKGDVVRLMSGDVGEIIEVWGLARTFARVRSGGRILLVMESDIDTIYRKSRLVYLKKS